MILFLFGGLPGLRRNERLEQASTWSLASGTVAASFALILWRSKERVFLDPRTSHAVAAGKPFGCGNTPI